MQDEHLKVHVFCDFDGTITKKILGMNSLNSFLFLNHIILN